MALSKFVSIIKGEKQVLACAQSVHLPHFEEGSPQDAVKVMAKSLVRNRHAVTKMYSLKSQLQAVSLRMAVNF